MTKFAIGLVLLAAGSIASAAGCWQNGKYVQCVKNADSTQTSDLSR